VKKRILTLAVAAAVGGATAAVPVSSADDGGHNGVSSHQQVRGHWRSVRGSEITEATIRISRDTSTANGTQTTATIDLQKFDPTRRPDQPFVHYQAECPPECSIPNSAFMVEDSSHARLDVTLRLPEVASVPPQFRNVTFHLVWRGVGAKDTTRDVTRDAGVKTTTASSARQAVATGTITDGANSFVEGPSDAADMQSVATRSSHGDDAESDGDGDA
jgi:hypothetical protein